MIFEFQIERAGGEWGSLGLARTATEAAAFEGAALALRASCGGLLPVGIYRVRVIELEARWRYAEVDDHGAFRLIDLPAARD